MKKEGGMVVNKNFYPPPPLLPQKLGFNLPTASQSARPHTKPQNTSRDATCRVDQQCPPRPRSLQNNMAPPRELLQQDSTSGCQITEINLNKGQGEQKE